MPKKSDTRLVSITARLYADDLVELKYRAKAGRMSVQWLLRTVLHEALTSSKEKAVVR
jgi:predicted DNA binding CopG/RHH family protein